MDIIYTYLQHVVPTSLSECLCHRDYQVNHLKYAKKILDNLQAKMKF